MRKRCSIQQGEKITVDQSKVLKNQLSTVPFFFFLGGGPPGIVFLSFFSFLQRNLNSIKSTLIFEIEAHAHNKGKGDPKYLEEDTHSFLKYDGGLKAWYNIQQKTTGKGVDLPCLWTSWCNHLPAELKGMHEILWFHFVLLSCDLTLCF